MADNKIEILTSNAKQVINDYVLGTDTDFQKVENAIQELAENDISTLNWNSLENYPDRSHDYQFSYNNSDGTINICGKYRNRCSGYRVIGYCWLQFFRR